MGTETKKFRKSYICRFKRPLRNLTVSFDQEVLSEEDYNKANSLRSEYVVAAVGTVEKRSAAINENLKTGDIEIKVHTLRILSESETPPFPIDENQTVKDELRFKIPLS